MRIPLSGLALKMGEELLEIKDLKSRANLQISKISNIILLCSARRYDVFEMAVGQIVHSRFNHSIYC